MEGLTLKQAMRKGKAKICSADKCSQISRNKCEKCQQPSCKFHMCCRVVNNKKTQICDNCNYAEIREQLDLENQKEKNICLEKLNNLNDKNNECIEEAKADEKTISDIEKKIVAAEREHEINSQSKVEEIRKEHFLKDNNLQMLASLKSAIESSSIVNKTENEKLLQVRSSVSNFEIDIRQIESSVKGIQNLIRSLKEQLSNSITIEKAEEVMCLKCCSKARGRSFITSVNVSARYSAEVEKKISCSKCIVQ